MGRRKRLRETSPKRGRKKDRGGGQSEQGSLRLKDSREHALLGAEEKGGRVFFWEVPYMVLLRIPGRHKPAARRAKKRTFGRRQKNTNHLRKKTLND